MLKNRRVLIGLFVLTLLGVILGVLALLPARPGVTRANFDRTEIGMPCTEVEAIFGEAADLQARGRLFIWIGADGSARISLDADDRVREKIWVDFPDERSVFEKLLDYVPWRPKPPGGRVFVL